MSVREDLLRQAKEARASADRARRLAGSWGISSGDDVVRLIAYAAASEKRAEQLEAQALAADLSLPPVTPVVTHPQPQVQQQSDSTSSESEPTKSPDPN